MSEQLYTLGVWLVESGKEEQFVEAWSEFAAWTKSSHEGAMSALLLKDQNAVGRFVSVGPWRSAGDVAAWRDSEGFKTRVRALQPLLKHFEPGSFTVACEIRD